MLVQRAPGADPAVLGGRGATSWVRSSRTGRPTVAPCRPESQRTVGSGSIEFLPVDGGEPIRWPASDANEGSRGSRPTAAGWRMLRRRPGPPNLRASVFASGEKIRVSPRGGLQPDWRRMAANSTTSRRTGC